MPRATLLDGFLAAVAARVRRRELAGAGLWTLAAWAGLVLAGAGVAAGTRRGDLAAPIVAAAAAGAVAALGVRAVRRTRRLSGTRHRTALTIAQNRRPLTRGSATVGAAELAADLALRREILGATELAGDDALAGVLGSPDLAEAYVFGVAARIRACDPGLAAPPLRPRAPVLALAALAVGGAALSSHPAVARGFALLFAAEDGRPPVPPEPLWSSLRVTLVAPPHAGRPERVVQNPSGSLRVLAGTRVDLELTTRRPVAALHVVVAHDPSPDAPTPGAARVELVAGEGGAWTGSFTARASGSWRLVADDAAPAFPLELEPDEPPEVELAPLPRSQGEPSEQGLVELRFKARDDFGLAQATLVFAGPDGEELRLDAGAPPPRARTWQHRYTWDLSSVPLADRRELTYWIEVRDNDPGLGLVPLADPPGKPARSAKMKLQVRDEEREHAENLESLAALRDAAVDLLARRMLADGPGPEGQVEDPQPDDELLALARQPPEQRRLTTARELVAASERLLTAIRAVIDALSVDALTPARDVATLTAIHRRLLDLHRREADLHAEVPPGGEASRPLAGPLARLAAVNRQQVTQLEDEVIRLDDLVDDQVVAQIEQLVARLQASQQKLVDLLEKLKAGDESVRGEIDQLQQRIREDLRRLADARAKLDKEVGQEFLNMDAFQAMEAKLRQQDVGEQLRQGDVDGALDQARGALDELRQLREGVQQRLAENPRASERMTPQERARMELMRELSRLQDEEVGLRSDTRGLHQQWRAQAEATPIDPATARKLAQKAAALRKQLDAVNDARLGRDARRALEDAREQLQHLEAEAASDPARALQGFEAAQQATRALRRASAGAGEGSPERRELEQAGNGAQRLQDQLAGLLPGPDAGLGDEQKAQFEAARQRQAGLRGRAEQLLNGPEAAELPEPGKQALRAALEDMAGSAEALGQRRGGPAGDAQSGAIAALQRALDSLRQSSAPARSASHEQTSTETERDRSLRDELMDAMKEGAPDGFDREVERYYEELLR
jgi:hypothetical protein